MDFPLDDMLKSLSYTDHRPMQIILSRGQYMICRLIWDIHDRLLVDHRKEVFSTDGLCKVALSKNILGIRYSYALWPHFWAPGVQWALIFPLEVLADLWWCNVCWPFRSPSKGEEENKKRLRNKIAVRKCAYCKIIPKFMSFSVLRASRLQYMLLGMINKGQKAAELVVAWSVGAQLSSLGLLKIVISSRFKMTLDHYRKWSNYSDLWK